jgi:hypothetical protein
MRLDGSHKGINPRAVSTCDFFPKYNNEIFSMYITIRDAQASDAALIHAGIVELAIYEKPSTKRWPVWPTFSAAWLRRTHRHGSLRVRWINPSTLQLQLR